MCTYVYLRECVYTYVYVIYIRCRLNARECVYTSTSISKHTLHMCMSKNSVSKRQKEAHERGDKHISNRMRSTLAADGGRILVRARIEEHTYIPPSSGTHMHLDNSIRTQIPGRGYEDTYIVGIATYTDARHQRRRINPISSAGGIHVCCIVEHVCSSIRRRIKSTHRPHMHTTMRKHVDVYVCA